MLAWANDSEMGLASYVSPATCNTPCAWPKPSTPAWSGINRGLVSDPPLRSAASNKAASDARERATGLRSTKRPSTSALTGRPRWSR